MKTDRDLNITFLLLAWMWVLTFVVMYLNNFTREDVNHDGKVDIHDLLIVQKYIIKENEK